MGRTLSIDLRAGRPATKDPRHRLEAEAVRRNFLARPGATTTVPNPDLPPAAQAVVQALLDAPPPADVVLAGDVREGTGGLHVLVEVVEVRERDALCRLMRTGRHKDITLETLRTAYRLQRRGAVST